MSEDETWAERQARERIADAERVANEQRRAREREKQGK